MAKTILIVDDDGNIREVVRFAMTKAGFQTVEAVDGQQALQRFKAAVPDLIVLDILMPELDGTEVVKIIRKTSRVPIIFLTSMDEEADRIIGLELGGDDYINKPFSPRELVARVKAVLRRAEIQVQPNVQSPSTTMAPVLAHGKLSLDANLFRVTWSGQEVTLTATEFALLAALFGYPGKVYSRDELMQRALGDNIVVTDRTIDSHVRRIRKKFAGLGGDPIETVHGVGYKLAGAR